MRVIRLGPKQPTRTIPHGPTCIALCEPLGVLGPWNTYPCLRELESLRIDKHASVSFAWAERMKQQQTGRADMYRAGHV